MHLTLEQIELLLKLGADRPVEVDGGDALAHSQLEHALQTAAVLRGWRPDDEELAVAGLVHDIGHLLDGVGVDGVGDANHAEAGGAAVRVAQGERVAALVGLHVEAKRYRVGSEGAYGGGLAARTASCVTGVAGAGP